MGTENEFIIKVDRVEAGGPEDLAWLKRTEQLQLDALPNVRATAERWAATMTALLGAVGLAALLNGPKTFSGLDSMAEDWGKVCFFAAVFLALVATAFAIAAAQYTSRAVFLPTVGTFKEASDHAVETAVSRLQKSRWLAGAAVSAALISAGFLWWGDSDAKRPRVIEVQGCGPVAGGGTVPRGGTPDFVLRCRPN